MFKTIFSSLDTNSKPSEEEINKIPPFIFNRWLGNNPFTIQAANQLNLFPKIPVVNQYYTVKGAFGGKKLYISYPKNTKDESKELELLANHFKISLEKAKEYKELLSDDEFEAINKMYERT